MGPRGPPFVFYEFNGARLPQQFLCGSIETQHPAAFPNGIDSGQNRNVIADFRHDNLAVWPYSMFISELLRNHQLPLLCNTHSMHYNLRHSVQPIIAELYHRGCLELSDNRATESIWRLTTARVAAYFRLDDTNWNYNAARKLFNQHNGFGARV
jgi:hypothetical protein